MKNIILTDADFQEMIPPNPSCSCKVVDQPFCCMKMNSEQVDHQLFFMHSQTTTQQAVRISMTSDYFSAHIGIGFMLNGQKNHFLQGWIAPLQIEANQLIFCYAPIMSGYTEYFANRNTISSGFYLDLALLEQLLQTDPRPQVQALFEPIYKDPSQTFLLTATISPAMLTLLNELHSQKSIGLFNGFQRRARMYELLHLTVEQIIHEHCAKIDQLKLHTSDILKLEQVKTILNENMQKAPSLAQISKQVGLNEYKLKRGFKQINQKTIFQYLTELRMQYAAHLLLHTKQPIVEISQKVGYNNHGHFSAAFREYFAKTPSTFRKEQN